MFGSPGNPRLFGGVEIYIVGDSNQHSESVGKTGTGYVGRVDGQAHGLMLGEKGDRFAGLICLTDNARKKHTGMTQRAVA